MPFESKFYLPEKAVLDFETALEEYAGAILTRPIEKGSHIGQWEIQLIFETEPDHEQIRKILKSSAEKQHIKAPILRLKKLPDINWLEASYRGFPPIEVGKYYIYGSHITDTPPADKIALKIDAATAFGTGEHQTTHGCLQALTDLTNPPKTVLDVGCGSGILAMAFAKTYHQAVDAVDIDPESVRVTQENIQNNGLEKLVSVWQSDGYKKVTKQYDLIFCNILAKPLIDMAKDLVRHLNKNGIAILSGFLLNQENWVQKAHEDAALTLVRTYRINGWSTLVMKKEF